MQIHECVPKWKNEKDVFNWLRSSVRRIWNKHPVKLEFKKSKRFKAPLGKNGKLVYACKCDHCQQTVRETQVDVDHKKGGFGFTDWAGFVKWEKMILWITFDDLRLLCKDCHAIVTHSQRKNLSHEEAKLDLKVIAYMKKGIDDQKAILHANGYKDKDMSNAKKRRSCFKDMLRNKDWNTRREMK